LLFLQTEEEAGNLSPLALNSPEVTTDMKCQRLHFLSLGIWWQVARLLRPSLIFPPTV